MLPRSVRCISHHQKPSTQYNTRFRALGSRAAVSSPSPPHAIEIEISSLLVPTFHGPVVCTSRVRATCHNTDFAHPITTNHKPTVHCPRLSRLCATLSSNGAYERHKSIRFSSPSPRGDKGKYMVMGVLSTALDLAKAAVAHDEQGALPEKVLPYYKNVSLSKRKQIETRSTSLNMNIH